MEILQQSELNPSLSIPNFLKVASRITEKISPYLASRLTSFIFSTPVKFATPKREKYFLKSAQKKRVSIQSIGKEIEVLSYGYSKKKSAFCSWLGR